VNHHSEDAIVARLRASLRRGRAVAGIGDDCAAVETPRGKLLLLKTDCVVEKRHFRADASATAVGWKAACRAVSDIAACGGEPQHALITCVLRDKQTGRWLDGLYRGIEKAGREFGFHVVGGELARTDGPAVVNVAMTGAVARREFIARGGGRVGDILYVTGALGESLRSGWHLRFRPRLAEARWLAETIRPSAMMDLSDGLAADLPRLATASGTGFIIEPEAIPRRRGASLRAALADGEDFELLFAVPKAKAARLEREWKRKFAPLRLTRVGQLAKSGIARGLGAIRGYDHFADR
jgi:thiamine-monophosphate kinase